MKLSSVDSLITERLRQLPVAVSLQLPSGERIGPEDAAVRLQFHDMASLVHLGGGEIGVLAQDMVEGRVSFEATMRDLMAAAAGIVPVNPVQSHDDWWSRWRKRMRSMRMHTIERDAHQIQFHYDVSDDFYALWLDPRRVYSCAYYRTPDATLAQAQEAKLDHICRKLQLRPGERFLDIGAGWGGLLLWAAEHYGVDATGITLSRNQHAYVNRLIEAKGLQGRVRMELRDYRELPADQPFDKIASVGMFEHVGRAYMGQYFEVIHRLLRPGGMVLNHGITGGGPDNVELGAGMGEFIEKYIFPGGELLHVSHVLYEMAHQGLEMVDTENLRPHYARTLWAWSDALERQLDRAQAVLEAQHPAEAAGRILRAYRLYLAGCAMSFERGWIALHQILAVRPTGDVETGPLRGQQSDYPFSRDYMYRTE